jgi:hypothetical protein
MVVSRPKVSFLFLWCVWLLFQVHRVDLPRLYDTLVQLFNSGLDGTELAWV